MQYTEEHYAEMYNSLPKGLRELVLSGQLSILSGSIALKYKLSKDETELLETAIEDVCLGMATQEELPDHIALVVGLGSDTASTIATEAEKTILEEYTDEIALTRKYKIELDERIRKEQSKEERAKAEERTRAENIIKVTAEQPKKQQGSDRVSDWYHGYYEEKAFKDTSADTNSASIQPETKTAVQIPVKQFSEVKAAAVPEFVDIKPKTLPKQNTSAEDTQTKKTFKDFLTTDTPGSFVGQDSVSNSGDVSKSITRLEQQMWNLNQSIGRLVEKSAAGQAVPQAPAGDDARRLYDELSLRFDLVSKKLDDLQQKYTEAQGKIKTLEKEAAERKKFDDIKKSEAATSIPVTKTPEKEASAAKVFTSNVSKSSLDTILSATAAKTTSQTSPQPKLVSTAPQQTTETAKKVLSLDELLSRKNEFSALSKNSTPAPQPAEVTQKAPEPVKTETQTTVEAKPESKPSLGELLQKDAAYIDETIYSTEKPKETVVEKVSDLSEELLVATEEDRMKKLQDKIRALNKGISSGGVASMGTHNKDESLMP